ILYDLLRQIGEVGRWVGMVFESVVKNLHCNKITKIYIEICAVQFMNRLTVIGRRGGCVRMRL
ncbi:TPA: hypothetical protein ACFJTN_001129, partial [Neisseria gonorrhoeae]